MCPLGGKTIKQNPSNKTRKKPNQPKPNNDKKLYNSPSKKNTNPKPLTQNQTNNEEKFPTCPPYWLLPDEEESWKNKNNLINS